MMKDIKVGDVRDFRNFMGAVIDKKAFARISDYLDHAKKNAKVIQGGVARGERAISSSPRSSKQPTPAIDCCARRFLVRSSCRRVSGREVVGDARCRRSDVALCVDRRGVCQRSGRRAAGDERLAQRRRQLLHQRQADRPVVGQQPFGGARASGTNDKAGSKLNLVRWVSARTVKETFVPPRDYKYPFMQDE